MQECANQTAQRLLKSHPLTLYGCRLAPRECVLAANQVSPSCRSIDPFLSKPRCLDVAEKTRGEHTRLINPFPALIVQVATI